MGNKCTCFNNLLQNNDCDLSNKNGQKSNQNQTSMKDNTIFLNATSKSYLRHKKSSGIPSTFLTFNPSGVAKNSSN